MTIRKVSYLQGTVPAPYKLPAEDHRLNLAMLWTPDSTAPRGPLGVRSGVVYGPGEPGKVTVAAGGVNINPFHVVIQGTLSQAQGVYEFTSDAVEFRAVTAASSTEFRRGYVVARVYDQLNAGAGTVQDLPAVEVIYGPNAATAVAAILPGVPANSVVLREFAVSNTGVITLVGGTIWTAKRGAAVPVNTDAERLAMTGLWDGLKVRVLATGVEWTWFGAGTGGWVALGAWTTMESASNFAWVVPVGGSPGTVMPAIAGGANAAFPVTVPAGRTLEAEWTVPLVSLVAGATLVARLMAGAALLDGAVFTVAAGAIAPYLPMRLAGSIVGTGAAVTVSPQAWSIGSSIGMNANGALPLGIRLRYRIV